MSSTAHSASSASSDPPARTRTLSPDPEALRGEISSWSTPIRDVSARDSEVFRDLFLSQGRDIAIGDPSSGWRPTIAEMNAGIQRYHSNWEDNNGPISEGRSSLGERGSPQASSPEAGARAWTTSGASPGASPGGGSVGRPSTRHSGRRSRVNVKQRFPNLHAWASDRVGTYSTFWILALVLFDGAAFMQVEYAWVSTINPMSVLVMKAALSLCVSVGLSVALEGPRVLCKLSIHYTWRWLVIAALFFAGEWLHWMALRTGLHEAIVWIIGYSYMPISAALSVAVFSRPYGRLEWLAMAMMCLAIGAFIVIRERCVAYSCEQFQTMHDLGSLLGVPCMMLSVLSSVAASTLAERIYKNRAQGIVKRRCKDDPFYIMKVYLDSCYLLIALCVWSVPKLFNVRSMALGEGGRVADLVYEPEWFGAYTKRTWFLVVILVGRSWLAGLVAKHFSTVVKALTQTMSTIFVAVLVDPFENLNHFNQRRGPSILMAVTVALCALVFQTGRINIKLHWQLLGKKPVAPMGVSLGRLSWSPSRELPDGALPAERSASTGAPQAAARRRLSTAARSTLNRYYQTAIIYASILCYIGADSFRTILQKLALSGPYFVPQSVIMMQAFCSLLLAVALVHHTEGWQGVRTSMNCMKLLKFMLPGFLTAVSGALGGMSYALGISAALNMALGKIYMAIAALLSRWILGKYYMWLEWFAIVILIDACMAFSLTDTLGEAASRKKETSGAAILCVLSSATIAAVNSLIMEKMLKGDPDPFRMQLVRLNFGNLFFSALILPVVGMTGIMGNRSDLAYWVYRPQSWHCVNMGTCDALTGAFVVNDPATAAEAVYCYCGKGIFVGWGSSLLVYTALAVNVFHGLITGLVVKQFSTVMRAVADGFPILIIFFILDPLFCTHTFPMDWARDLIALTIPLACVMFSIASSEMQEFQVMVASTIMGPDVGPISEGDKSLIESEEERAPRTAADAPGGEEDLSESTSSGSDESAEEPRTSRTDGCEASTTSEE